MKKNKLYISTTIPLTFIFFKGQPRLWKEVFDVCAISSEPDKLKQFADEEGIAYRYIPMKREISLFSDVVSLIKWILFLFTERPYIVHGNTPKASLISMVAAWITRRPVRVYMCHGLRYQGTEGSLRNLLQLMEKITCGCATHVVCVSKGVANVMINEGLCPKEKIRVVGYGSSGGVDIERYNPNAIVSNIRSELNIPEDAFVFSFIGRIVKDKGINELVSAFDNINKNNPNIHLLLVGPVESMQNPVDESTYRIIEQNENIHAVGMQKDVRPYLKASDAFILPSYREGFGMVLVEAGAMGLPCITTDITGCNEIIVPGENGAIIEPRNMEALRYEMEKWVSNPDMVKIMASNARKMVSERYDSRMVREQYFEFYKSL